MKLFDTRRFSQKQRFQAAILAGIVSAIGLGILSGIVRRILGHGMPFDFSIIIVIAAYGVGMSIQKIGRGVHQKFSILGALCAVFVVLISDAYTFQGFSAIFNIHYYTMLMRVYFSDGFNSLIWLAYRVLAVYVGYKASRVV